jgi:uncharacterized protein HemY
MIDLDTTDMFPWHKETVQNLIEDGEYPNLCEMSSEELKKLSNKLFGEAQELYETVCRIESDAEAIAVLARVKEAIGK